MAINGQDIRAQLVISETGMTELTAAGLTPGWLTGWLRSAGAHAVDVCMLEQEAWKRAADWYVFYAEEAELMRVALHFGRRMQAGEDGRCGLLGVPPLQLENPQRSAWYFVNQPASARVLLLPCGDIAGHRGRWLSLLNDKAPLLPMQVRLDTQGDIPLEVGMSCAPGAASGGDASVLNDGAYLPEESLMQALKSHNLGIRFAESCTAGGLAERLTRLPGASDVLDGGWVTYSNEAKHRQLGIAARLIEKHGAVSREVAEEMAKKGSDGQHACIAVSGIAGPDGGSEGKPVGTVWMAAALPDGEVRAACRCFSGSRAAVRSQTVVHAYQLLISALSSRR